MLGLDLVGFVEGLGLFFIYWATETDKERDKKLGVTVGLEKERNQDAFI